MKDRGDELPKIPGIEPGIEARSMSAFQVSSIAAIVRRSLPEAFAEIFAAGFDPGNPSKEDDVPGLGHLQVTRAVDEDWGKIITLSITDLDKFKNDPDFSSMLMTFVIGQNDQVINSRYTYFAIHHDGSPDFFAPNDPKAEIEIEKMAKRIARVFGINPNK